MPRIDIDVAIVFVEILETMNANGVLKRNVKDLQSALKWRMYSCSEINLYVI